MPHPEGGYRNAAGKRIPGVTSITGLWGDKNGIIYAANRLALEPLMQARALLNVSCEAPFKLWERDVQDFLRLDPDTWDHKKTWSKAADAGTCAHELFDKWIKKEDFDQSKYPLDIYNLALPAFRAATEWANQSNFKIIETEVSLISETYQFGGTRDACLANGKRAVADWKSSRDIYPEYLCQLAAYGILDEEAGNTVSGGYHLIQFSKQVKPDDPIRFKHMFWSHLDKPKEAFLHMRALYELMKDIKELAK